MKEIFERRSVRNFKDKPVESEKIELMLKAAMQAPSAANQQPWEYLVVQDRDTLIKLSKASPYGGPAAGCAVAFVLLANDKRLSIPTAWEQDLGAATENLLLEATYLGLGSVWIGVATSDAVSKNVRDIFALPDHIRPFALIAAGYPEGQGNVFIDRYQSDRVHYEKWL